MPQLECTQCGLSVRSRGPFNDRHFCPRCLARGLRHPFRLRLNRAPDAERLKIGYVGQAA
jgi:hypothetical protein